MRSFTNVAGLICLFLGGCISPETTKAVFLEPAKFVGSTHTVCGWLSGTSNIVMQRENIRPGLSITGDEASPNLKGWGEQRKICLSGKIGYIGCDTNPDVICTDAAYDYSITPTKII